MSDSTYNGWKNYETWNVKLWLDNEQGTYNDVTEHAREVVEAEGERYEFADWLKQYVEEMRPEMPASMFSDLLGAALSEVDWSEIAEAYMNDAKEEQDA